MKFIGHLDMLRFFQRLLRRAGFRVIYTEGMSPHMSMSFAFPLGVGMTSDSEYVDVDLEDRITGDEIVSRLNQVTAEGVHITGARQIGITKAEKGMAAVARADYTLNFREGCEWEPGWEARFSEWLKQDTILAVKKSKNTEKEINLRPMIYRAETDADGIHLGLSAGLNVNIRPELVMDTFARDSGYDCRMSMFLINRDEVFGDKGENGSHQFVSLFDLGEEIL